MNPQSKLGFMGTRSRVFLSNGMYYYYGLAMGGLLWNLLLFLTGFLDSIEYSIVQWFGISMLVCLLIQFTVYYLEKRQFRMPVTNTDLLTLFEEVQTELGKGRGIELRSSSIDGDIFLSTANPLFKAILLSESAIADILDKREKGKIVLARELLLIERVSPFLGTVVGLLMFTLFPYVMLFGPISFFTAEQLTLILVFLLVLSGLFLIEDPLNSSRRTRHVDQFLEEKYGTSPTTAIVEVLEGYSIAKDVIEQQKREKAEGDAGRRRKAVADSLFAAIMTSLVSFIILVRILPDSLSFIVFPILISFLLGYAAFLLVYLRTYMMLLRNRIDRHSPGAS